MVMLRRKKWLNVRLGGLDSLEHGVGENIYMEEAKKLFLSHLSYGTKKKDFL